MTSQLKVIEEYLTFNEGEAEGLIESVKQNAPKGGYEVVGYTTIKKNKKNVEYYIVKITKEFALEKELVADSNG
jgi:hypothetical protein